MTVLVDTTGAGNVAWASTAARCWLKVKADDGDGDGDAALLCGAGTDWAALL
jgi:hypothetical protein